MIASQSRLRNRLSFVKFEFLSHEHKIWCTNQTVVKIVTSENIISIERLSLLQRNWEIFYNQKLYHREKEYWFDLDQIPSIYL